MIYICMYVLVGKRAIVFFQSGVLPMRDSRFRRKSTEAKSETKSTMRVARFDERIDKDTPYETIEFPTRESVGKGNARYRRMFRRG